MFFLCSTLACASETQCAPAMLAICLALLLGVLVFALMWKMGALEHIPADAEPSAQRAAPAQPSVEERPVVGKINALSDSELEQQKNRRGVVRERCESAAAALAAYAQAAKGEPRTIGLQESLGVLQVLVNENEADGALGVVASTELCNVLLAADVLQTLEGLQNDADPIVAARACAVFQHVIPRIWAF